MRLMLRFSTFLITMGSVVAPVVQGMTMVYPSTSTYSTSFPGTNANVQLNPAPVSYISGASESFQTT